MILLFRTLIKIFINGKNVCLIYPTLEHRITRSYSRSCSWDGPLFIHIFSHYKMLITSYYSMKPGRVVILLAGRHAGKKAIVVRQHDEGKKVLTFSFSSFLYRTRSSLMHWWPESRDIHWKWPRECLRRRSREDPRSSPLSRTSTTTTSSQPGTLWPPRLISRTWSARTRWAAKKPGRQWRKKSESSSTISNQSYPIYI